MIMMLQVTIVNMTIDSICNTINSFFASVRPPAKQLSKLLMLCSLKNRPGLSAIYSTANAVKMLNEMGFPTGPNPDGSPNMTVAMTYCIMNEVFRAMKEDASMQLAIQPGTPLITGGPGAATIANTETDGVVACT